MEDLFYGFVRNYVTFGLVGGSNNTKWTHQILGYFARLGRMLSYYVDYEWRRFDLVWFWSMSDIDEEKPTLHVEHENRASRLGELLKKIKSSHAPNVLVIGYPSSNKTKLQFLRKARKAADDSAKRVLAILDSFVMKRGDVSGHLFGPGIESENIEAMRRITEEDGLYYLELKY